MLNLDYITGLHHGTQQIKQAQMDRWSVVTAHNYLPHSKKVGILRQGEALPHTKGREHINKMT
jgi:cobaltochelatase CobS